MVGLKINIFQINAYRIGESMRFILIFSAVLFFSVDSFASAKVLEKGKSECGGIYESEFMGKVETQNFSIKLAAGDKLGIQVIPIGNYLNAGVRLIEPTGSKIEDKYQAAPGQINLESKVLSGSGIYKISVRNHYFVNGNPRQPAGGRAGAYSLLVTCTLRNGDLITPG